MVFRFSCRLTFFWKVGYNMGEHMRREFSHIEQIIREHLPELEEAWHEHFAK